MRGEAEGFKVLIEPDPWGDLVVRNDKVKHALVFEFKIGAQLENKQNPSKDEFWKAGGYGDTIKNKLKGFSVRMVLTAHPTQF